MSRIALAGALSCALLASACTPSDLSSLATAATVITPNLTADASVPAVLANAGVTPAGQATVATNIARVQVAAANICKFRPLASGILNVAIASSSNVAVLANSAPGQAVRGVATIICDGLSAPTYTALGRDRLVRVIVHINGFDVPVYGVRVR